MSKPTFEQMKKAAKKFPARAVETKAQRVARKQAESVRLERQERKLIGSFKKK